jgi:hypothetical protein
MSSSVISATNTQISSGRRPRVSVTKASFRIGRVSPDAVCRAHLVDGSLWGSPAAMSGLMTVTAAPVSMVTEQGLSATQPWATSLFPFLSVTTLKVGGLSACAGFPPSLPAPARFPRVDHPFGSFPRSFLFALQTISPVLVYPSGVVHPVSLGGRCIRLSSHSGSSLESGHASHISNTPLVGGLFV